MTIPPFYESVTWIVFKEPMEISRDQVKQTEISSPQKYISLWFSLSRFCFVSNLKKKTRLPTGDCRMHFSFVDMILHLNSQFWYQ